MRPYVPFLALSVTLAATLIGCGGSGAGTPATPTPQPTATPVPTPTPIPTPTPTPTPIPSRSFQLAVSGSRGSVAIAVNGAASTLAPGTTKAVTLPVVGTSLLSAPAAYGDKAFVGWQRNGVTVSTSATLNALPAELAAGETLTATYGPGGTRTSNLTPNYNQTDSYKWPVDKIPLKVFFAADVSSDFKSIVIAGLDRWMNALGGGITYTVVSTEAEGTLFITLGDAGGFLARTTTTASALTLPKPILKAEIVFDSTKLPPLTSESNRLAVTALAAHECGHALGINGGGVQGHSDDPADTMHAIVGEDNATITVRDINTLMNIYDTIFDGRHVPVSRAVGATGTFRQVIDCNIRLK